MVVIGLNGSKMTAYKRCGMYKFFRAIMWIETSVLGLYKNTDIVPPHERSGLLILCEMLKGGNFGVGYNISDKNIVGYYAKQIGYNLRYVFEFPSEPLIRPFVLVYDYLYKRIKYKNI